MRRAIIILSTLVLTVAFSTTGFAKDNNNGGAINYEGNGNIDDNGFTSNTAGKGGAITIP